MERDEIPNPYLRGLVGYWSPRLSARPTVSTSCHTQLHNLERLENRARVQMRLLAGKFRSDNQRHYCMPCCTFTAEQPCQSSHHGFQGRPDHHPARLSIDSNRRQPKYWARDTGPGRRAYFVLGIQRKCRIQQSESRSQTACDDIHERGTNPQSRSPMPRTSLTSKGFRRFRAPSQFLAIF